MELLKAQDLADELIEFLLPLCSRAEVAGSTRRKKPNVHDIEIVAIPKNINNLKNKLGLHLLRSDGKAKSNPFMKAGDKYIQFRYKGEQIDLFLAEEDNWGLIYLIRTGSAAFSAHILATWKKVTGGGYSENGYLHTADGKKIVTKEETDVFKLCRMEFVDPELRS
jgi:DNA polymerase/3'-5' exonuclease PolX